MNNLPPSVMIGISILLALVPVIVWSQFLLKEEKDYRKIHIAVFIGGTLSVLPIFGLQKLWEFFPDLDIFGYIETASHNQNIKFALTYMIVGILEELTKWNILRVIDKHHPEYIQTLKGAVKFGIASGLGFAFAENIFYFFNIWKTMGLLGLLLPFFFRSMFTVAGHMIFSGIFGYFYGLSKFAEDIRAQKQWMGDRFAVAKFFHRLLHISSTDWYRTQLLIYGLGLALGIHAAFNFLLQLNQIPWVILLIVASFLYTMYLWSRKSGHLIFTIVGKRDSTMAAKDEDVVMELLGMWTNQGRYGDVVSICNRLLKRDPDNNVVKLFRAKAVEKMKAKSVIASSVQKVFGKEMQTGQKTVLPDEDEPQNTAQDAPPENPPQAGGQNVIFTKNE